MRKLLTVLALFLTGLVGVSRGDNWPSFRGPGGSGLTTEKNLPTSWSADKNVAWKTAISGRGWSSPVVWKDRVFITSASSDQDDRAARGGGRGSEGGGRPGDGRQGRFGGRGGFGGGRAPDVPYKFEVYCLDLGTGKVVWKQLALEAKPKIPTQSDNTYATETPVTDGERVYAYFGMTGLFCYDFSGNLVWKKDLGAYPMQAGWGTASSPVLDGDRLFLQIDNEEKSILVALNTRTGDEVWRNARSERSNWCSPIIWKNKKRTELVAGGSKVRSHDPATGKVLWELSVGGDGNKASPVGDDEHLYVGGGGGRGAGSGGPGGGGRPDRGGFGGRGGGTLYAVKAGAAGDITPKEGQSSSDGLAWSQPGAGPPMASPLSYQGYVYVLQQNGGMVSCYDATSGKPAYQRERLPRAGAFWASPWGYDGKVFCLDESGTTHVLQAGPDFKVLSQNSLGERFRATPAVAEGSLVLRGVQNVYRIKQ